MSASHAPGGTKHGPACSFHPLLQDTVSSDQLSQKVCGRVGHGTAQDARHTVTLELTDELHDGHGIHVTDIPA